MWFRKQPKPDESQRIDAAIEKAVFSKPEGSFDIEDDGPLPEVENIQGWRRVQVLPMGILASPQQAELMLEQVSPVARCLTERDYPQHESHKPPMHDCCGWHAMYEEWNLNRWALGEVKTLVSAIGETLLCREGWVAEQIRVDEVWVPQGFDEKLSRKIGERYNVPVMYQEEPPCTSESQSNALSPSQQKLRDVQRSLMNAPVPTSPFFQPGNPLPSPPGGQRLGQLPAGFGNMPAPAQFAQEAQKIVEDNMLKETQRAAVRGILRVERDAALASGDIKLVVDLENRLLTLD